MPKFKVKSEVKCTELYDSIILFNTRDGCYFEFNDVGRLMWKQIVKAGSKQDMVYQLTKEIDAEPNKLKISLDKFTKYLLDQGIIEEIPINFDNVEGKNEI